jgi:hypothetical protein
MHSWYERFGIQINQPPGPPADYVRPSQWKAFVVPVRWSVLVHACCLAVTAAVVALIGGRFETVLFTGLGVGAIAQLPLDAWWRRNRPPSADRPPGSVLSKHPDDYY